MPITLRDYQQKVVDGVYNSWQNGNRNVALVMGTGLGKCHGRDTPILMFNGKVKKVQDIQAGEFVMGPDSQPRFVVSTTHGFGQLYKITPVKGDSFVVNSEHILSLKRTSKIKNDPEKGKVVNIPVKDYLQKNKTFKHIHKQWRTGVDFSNRKVDFDPYMLGLWLGDGSSDDTQITNPEPEIISYCKDFAEKHDMKLRFYQKPNNKAWKISFSKKILDDKKPCYFRKFLKDYNLFKNKHIPLEYKTACREDRLKLLAGILDTDGSLSQNSFDLIFKSEKLLDDTIFLARSLGLACYKTPCLKTCTNTNVTDVYYRCCIQGETSIIPTKVERKKAKKRQQIKDVLVTGFNVENIGEGDYYGFEVYGNDRLYLLGDFTVTHNSVCMSSIALNFKNQHRNVAVIAHRNELVSQMSCHLARAGIVHRVIASKNTVRQIINEHREIFGKSFVSPTELTAVVGVDTLISRYESLKAWAQQISLWEIDEYHHCTVNNKWGKAVQLFQNAYGLGVTATPNRADGQGLGRWADGYTDDMIIGPSMRWSIEHGFLADYEIVCPKSDLKVDDSQVSANGDWSNQTLRKAAKKSKIVGDVVQNYIKYAVGRQAIVFATDVETADEISKDFNEHNIKAVSLNGNSHDTYRKQSLKLFAKSEIQVLVNVDLFDEGLDIKGCDVVIMARPTASLGKYLQSVGRALRPAPGKTALIIDHVSNVIRHGLPDMPREWTLDRRQKKAKQVKDPDEIELTVCKNCLKPYEKFRTVCPYCGAEPALPEPRSRSIEMVEGDLILLDRAALERMRRGTMLEAPGSVAERVARVAGPIAAKGVANRQIEKIAAQGELKDAIAQWAAIERSKGFNDREIYRRFYLSTGMDVLTALDGSRSRQDYLTTAERVRGWYKNA